MSTKILLSFLSGLAALTAVASPDVAPAEYLDSLGYDLNPIVVTGTGMQQRLKSPAVPVEVITGHE
ncbi:MAG: hypothetical protein K2K77_03965, partial [Duncaniella sp.]|nr:hypothetical protein [Duncaniella sp.]